MGIDIIHHFQINLDTLVLPEELAVDQLGLSVEGGNTFLQFLETNKTLAILEGLATELDELSFVG